VHAELDENDYPLGERIPDAQMRALETDGIFGVPDSSAGRADPHAMVSAPLWNGAEVNWMA